MKNSFQLGSFLLAITIFAFASVAAPESSKEKDLAAQVTILSDGEIWIRIDGPTKIPPHKLTNSTFVLEPGAYTIIGRKVRFEDVTVEVELKPGNLNKPIKIFCKKPWKG